MYPGRGVALGLETSPVFARLSAGNAARYRRVRFALNFWRDVVLAYELALSHRIELPRRVRGQEGTRVVALFHWEVLKVRMRFVEWGVGRYRVGQIPPQSEAGCRSGVQALFFSLNRSFATVWRGGGNFFFFRNFGEFCG